MSVETRRGTMTDTLQAPDVGAPRLAAYNARRIGFAAGVAAAAIMLLAIVLLRLLSGVMSLPEVVAAGLFGQHLQAGVLWHAVSLLIVIGVFGIALYHAYAALVHRALPSEPDHTRRLLLRNAAVGIVATVGAGSLWRLLSGEGASTFAAPPVASGTGALSAATPNPPPFDLKGLATEVTPAADFYTVSKNFIDPAVAVGGWRLKIGGLVDRPMELTYEQLTALPASAG